MDRTLMPPSALSPSYPTTALGHNAHPYESHPPPDAYLMLGDNMVGKSLGDRGGLLITQNAWLSLQLALLCLYPGCDVQCPDEVLLDCHVETHSVSGDGAVGREVLPRRQHVQHMPNVASPYLYAPAGPYDSSRNLSLTSPSLATPIDGFSVTDSKDRFFCGHGGCSKTFTRAADLERHAKVYQEGPREYGCPAPGCTRNGAKGFTRKDKLADHWKCKHLGALGGIAAWVV